jgi:hypothetical protein
MMSSYGIYNSNKLKQQVGKFMNEDISESIKEKYEKL